MLGEQSPLAIAELEVLTTLQIGRIANHMANDGSLAEARRIAEYAGRHTTQLYGRL